MHEIFVYGTLRRGERNAALLSGAQRLREVRTAPQYTLYALGSHPGLGEQGATAVVGEVYAVDAPTLARLDALEDHPHWYERKAIALADGSSVEGYVLPERFTAGLPVIADGDWVRYRRLS